MWDDGGRKTKLNKVEFTDTGSISRQSAFNVAAQEGERTLNGWLVGWLEYDQKVAQQK